MSADIKWPRMTAIVGDHPKLMNDGRRVYFPHVVIHANDEHDFDDKLTVNVCGNHVRDQVSGRLDGFDRFALLIAAAPKLLEVAKQYAFECGECDGTGLDAVGHEGACEDCAHIRAAIAAAEGTT